MPGACHDANACKGGHCHDANTTERSWARSLLPGPRTFSTSKVGGWRLAVGGGWRLAVGGPWGLSLTKKKLFRTALGRGGSKKAGWDKASTALSFLRHVYGDWGRAGRSGISAPLLAITATGAVIWGGLPKE